MVREHWREIRAAIRQDMESGMLEPGAKLPTERVVASEKVATALALSPGAQAIPTRRRSFADGVPVSFGTLYHDAFKFSEFPARREVMGSVSTVYASFGIADYKRVSTHIHASSARADEVQLLRQHPDMPVLAVQAIDADLDGTPIAYSEVIWSAARVTFDIADMRNDA